MFSLIKHCIKIYWFGPLDFFEYAPLVVVLSEAAEYSPICQKWHSCASIIGSVTALAGRGHAPKSATGHWAVRWDPFSSQLPARRVQGWILGLWPELLCGYDQIIGLGLH